MNRLTCLFPAICSAADPAIAPTAIHRNVSDGSRAVCSSMVLATGPSECSYLLSRSASVAITHLLPAMTRQARNYCGKCGTPLDVDGSNGLGDRSIVPFLTRAGGRFAVTSPSRTHFKERVHEENRTISSTRDCDGLQRRRDGAERQNAVHSRD